MAPKTWSARRKELVTVSTYCPERAYVQVHVPDNISRVSRIKFKLRSNDQGFSNDQDRNRGSYDSSYSWFEVRIVGSNGHCSGSYTLQHNRHAMIQPFKHEHVWDLESSDEVIKTRLRSITAGDWIQVVPKARFVAWRNYVHKASIEVTGEEEDGPVTSPVESLSKFSITGGIYESCPLSSDSTEIRVLGILPGRPGDTLRCSIRCISLDDAEKTGYEALSYCWGVDKSHEALKLTIGEEEFDKDITKNLHRALCVLRRPSGAPRTIWADAVCIDQGNLKEREHQVAIMKKVYAKASNVIVWLGDPTGNVEQYLKDARLIASRYGALPPDDPVGSNYFDYHFRLHDSKSAPWGTWIDSEIPILNFDWFHRAWVVQEVFNAKSVEVHCGETAMPWALLLRMNRCMNLFGVNPSARKKTVMPPLLSGLFDNKKYTSDPLGEKYSSVARAATMSSLDVLTHGIDFDATDPRDNIFAFLSFGGDMDSDLGRADPLIRPNYQKSTAAVFQDYTRWWIITNSSLRILSAIHISVGRSWQTLFEFGIDIDTIVQQRATWSFWHGGRSSWVKATLGLSAECPYKASLSTTPNLELLRNPISSTILSLEGLVLGKISTIDAFPYYAQHQAPEELYQVYEDLFEPYNQKGTWTVASYEQTETFDSGRQLHIDKNVCNADHLSTHFKYARNTGGGVECHPKPFFATENGLRGLCPPGTRRDDVVVVLFGGDVPYVLRAVRDRQKSGEARYLFVGECYVQDYMNGLAVEEKERGEGDRVTKTFPLI